MVRTMYLRRCFYKASLEAKTLTFLSRCVRVSFCAVIKEKTGSPYLLYIWKWDEPRQCCNIVIVSVLLIKSRNARS